MQEQLAVKEMLFLIRQGRLKDYTTWEMQLNAQLTTSATFKSSMSSQMITIV